MEKYYQLFYETNKESVYEFITRKRKTSDENAIKYLFEIHNQVISEKYCLGIDETPSYYNVLSDLNL